MQDGGKKVVLWEHYKNMLSGSRSNSLISYHPYTFGEIFISSRQELKYVSEERQRKSSAYSHKYIL